jgi:hypothetical protein
MFTPSIALHHYLKLSGGLQIINVCRACPQRAWRSLIVNPVRLVHFVPVAELYGTEGYNK